MRSRGRHCGGVIRAAGYGGSELRVGVIGVGDFGVLHAETIRRIEGAALTSVVDPSREKLSQWSSVPGVQTFPSIESQSALRSADAWIVASPTEHHVSLAAHLLAEGKFVLCEKPLSDSLEKTKRLASEDTDKLMMGRCLPVASMLDCF
jgi:myo-inositol 2-dehydrogenase/D-chiro-inositol 1-dehydrogenase